MFISKMCFCKTRASLLKVKCAAMKAGYLPHLVHRRVFAIASHQHSINKTTGESILPNGIETVIVPNVEDIQTRQDADAIEKWSQTPVPFSLQDYRKYYMNLSKYKLSTLVVVTTMTGYAIAPVASDVVTLLSLISGNVLMCCSANSINQFLEVPFDAQMPRTKNRVIVSGKVSPHHAIAFASITAVSGTLALYYGVNCVTTLLGLSNLIIYTAVYTPLKRLSIWNTMIGSFVGAIPPLCGYAACNDGVLDSSAWLLATMLYLWQAPHFYSLSWNLRPEYSRAGYRMMSVTEPLLCRKLSLYFTIGIQAITVLSPFLDVTSFYFILESLPINGYLGFLAYKFYKEADSRWSRKLYRYSLLHLPAWVILYLFNKKLWDRQKNKRNAPADES